MSFSLCVRKMVIGVGMVALLSGVSVLGQSGFLPKNGEYGLTGARQGDQVHPSLSVNSGGGYVVWQDNAVDGDGWGISGRALDSNLQGVSSPFRINGTGAGDQEKPQVALLKNGGAVFVWQGGPEGSQHIYARFLSPSNTWATGDVMVNASTDYFQIDPAVTVLTNGNVVIVWSSFDQQGATSMQDVFGQIFTPAGQRLYSHDIPINEFTPYNQRTPAIAALSGGGFFVAWVSEQERSVAKTNAAPEQADQLSYPSVDIYGRLYNQTGAPTLNEFLVNSGSNVCANPNVAAGSDGTLMVVWGERDTKVLKNGWDVFARPFTVEGGVPSGPAETYVNTQLFGDQIGPQVRALGTNFLVVWTSVGQDGSRQGVYGQFLNADGSHSGDEFRVNTTTASMQMQPALAADEDGSYLAAWTSYTGWPDSFDLYGQQYASGDYQAPKYATRYGAPKFVTGGSTNSTPPPVGNNTNSENLVLTFPDSLNLATEGSASNYQAVSGYYAGLFYETNGIHAASSGYFSAWVTRLGYYSASIQLGAHRFGFYGKLDLATGTSTVSLGRSGLTVSLQADLVNGDRIVGKISGSDWTSTLLALKYDPNPRDAGRYTMTMSSDSSQPNRPSGSSIGIFQVNGKGILQWAGAMVDGAKVSRGGFMCKDGVWPLYVPLYGGRGMLMSWMRFTTNQDIDARMIWIRPAGLHAMFYKDGFTNTVQASGSKYDLAKVNAWATGVSTNTLTLRGGGLSQSMSSALGISRPGHARLMGGPVFHWSVSRIPGVFSGRMLDVNTRRWLPFVGVLLENGGGLSGAGYFLGPTGSGNVELNIAP